MDVIGAAGVYLFIFLSSVLLFDRVDDSVIFLAVKKKQTKTDTLTKTLKTIQNRS